MVVCWKSPWPSKHAHGTGSLETVEDEWIVKRGNVTCDFVSFWDKFDFDYFKGWLFRCRGVLWAVEMGIPVVTTRLEDNLQRRSRGRWKLEDRYSKFNLSLCDVGMFEDIEEAFVWVDVKSPQEIYERVLEFIKDDGLMKKKKEQVLGLRKYFDWKEIAEEYVTTVDY